MLVIASIHQPSTNTLLLFDKVLLLSGGKTVYYGPPANSMRYFVSLGHPPPPLLSPAEFMLELSNTNFGSTSSIQYRVDVLCDAWDASLEQKLLLDKLITRDENDPSASDFEIRRGGHTGKLMKPFILLHRMAIVCLAKRPLILEILPRSPCIRSEYCHVPRPCHSHGNRLASTLLLGDQYSKCLEFIILWVSIHELHGINVRCFSNVRLWRISLHTSRIEPLWRRKEPTVFMARQRSSLPISLLVFPFFVAILYRF